MVVQRGLLFSLVTKIYWFFLHCGIAVVTVLFVVVFGLLCSLIEICAFFPFIVFYNTTCYHILSHLIIFVNNLCVYLLFYIL